MDVNTDKVVVLAMGISDYGKMQRLESPMNDVALIKNLLVSNPATALFKKNNYYELLDVTADEARRRINEILLSLEPSNSFLIFYFSGHGAPIGTEDFAFCLSDTEIHPVEEIIMPLSIIKFSDILKSFAIANVTPIIIIDSCYSGMASKTLAVSENETFGSMTGINAKEGISDFGLLVSSRANQVSQDLRNASLFTHYLSDISSDGISDKKDKPTLSLGDIYPRIRGKTENHDEGSTPIRIETSTFQNFPFVRNTQYSPPRYTFGPQFKEFLMAFWNDGHPIAMSTEEIRKNFYAMPGIYSNYSKLEYDIWDLLRKEKLDKKVVMSLSKKGLSFVKGKTTIPKAIIKDYKADPNLPSGKKYIKDPETEMIGINDVKKNE